MVPGVLGSLGKFLGQNAVILVIMALLIIISLNRIREFRIGLDCRLLTDCSQVPLILS